MHTRSTETLAQADTLFSLWGAAPAVGARFDRNDRASAAEDLLFEKKAERQNLSGRLRYILPRVPSSNCC